MHVPYPHPYRSPFPPPSPRGSGDATVDYLRDQVLFHAVDPRDVAGVIVEPIAGSGGVLIPPDGFWPALVELCREHGWLLCADEVKAGFGRTGTMFAVEHWGVEPDLMCLGKGMGGGVMPIGAVLGSERAMGGFDDVPTGSTWAWLPAACAAALETLDVFSREDVLGNVRALDARARETLGTPPGAPRRRRRRPHQGLLHGGRVRPDAETKERAPELQEAVADECLRRGLLADSSTASYNLQPSLVMPVEALDRAVTIVDEAIAAVLARPGGA